MRLDAGWNEAEIPIYRGRGIQEIGDFEGLLELRSQRIELFVDAVPLFLYSIVQVFRNSS